VSYCLAAVAARQRDRSICWLPGCRRGRGLGPCLPGVSRARCGLAGSCGR